MRADIIPPVLANELSVLQDKVAPFPYTEAKTIVEKELNCTLPQVFNSFEEMPIASASIGQVHKAILADGKVVAVKIQRSHIAEVTRQDLSLMRFAVNIFKFVRPEQNWFNWFQIIDELDKTIQSEMDYLAEGRSADRLRQVLRPFPSVIVPKVFWQYTTKHVLTEEFCQGEKIDRIFFKKELDCKRIAKNLFEAYLVQVVSYGYFHADPHAGNLAVNANSQLIIYDFGMMGSINKKQRSGLIMLMRSVIRNDVSLFVDSLADIGLIAIQCPDGKEGLLRLIAPVWSAYYGLSPEQRQKFVPEKAIDVFTLSKYFQLPGNLVYLIKMIIGLEAVLEGLDPNCNFLRVAAPYLKTAFSR